MIRFLQTFSAMSLTTAVAVFAFCVIQWTRGRPEVEPDTEHSIVEEFRQHGGESTKGFQPAVPPLVKQAKAFASYLNPPEPPKPARAQTSKPAVNRRVMTVKRPKTTPKFTLLATSYYRAVPEESLALVSEPGRKPRWIRSGERLGHFILAKVNRGKIVYQDGDRLGEMAINTKVTAPIEQIPQTTLASDEPEPSWSKTSGPDKPQKTRSRRPMHMLGPPRQAIHVVAYDHTIADS
ncbi:hypothetical protein ACFL5Z_14310 [Planctomycetota bacterium]